MSDFIHDDFLLNSEFAQQLYHGYAESLPIIDYHNHLPPAEIARNRSFENLTTAWLEGDHYKWRAMRTLGIKEDFITGNASHQDKFRQWAEAVPATVRNPLFHWTHLELKRYFGINKFLNPSTADSIYSHCSELLSKPDYSARGLLTRMRVEVLCTTDDPTDDLSFHDKIKSSTFKTKVFPAFRPDKVYRGENPDEFNKYLNKLEEVTGITIAHYEQLIEALLNRIDYFHVRGCRLADHGLEAIDWFTSAPAPMISIFERLRRGEAVSLRECQYFRSCVLLELCRAYHDKGWTQQFHLGALRNTNHRMLAKLGPDTGFDSMGDFQQAAGLGGFLNELDRGGQLARTILYNLNPSYNEVMATMIGNFNDGSIRGKMQFGSAWWFLDQKDGIEKQLNALSNMGMISTFVGMITDSRSFLSFPRHEYFRRILCNLLARDVLNGELPADEKWIGNIVSNICYSNARDYFAFS